MRKRNKRFGVPGLFGCKGCPFQTCNEKCLSVKKGCAQTAREQKRIVMSERDRWKSIWNSKYKGKNGNSSRWQAMRKTVDLRTCVPGDILVSKFGTQLRYVGYDKKDAYPHTVRYPNGSMGNRLDDGRVFHKSLPEDEDIVKIIHSYFNNKRTRSK